MISSLSMGSSSGDLQVAGAQGARDQQDGQAEDGQGFASGDFLSALAGVKSDGKGHGAAHAGAKTSANAYTLSRMVLSGWTAGSDGRLAGDPLAALKSGLSDNTGSAPGNGESSADGEAEAGGSDTPGTAAGLHHSGHSRLHALRRRAQNGGDAGPSSDGTESALATDTSNGSASQKTDALTRLAGADMAAALHGNTAGNTTNLALADPQAGQQADATKAGSNAPVAALTALHAAAKSGRADGKGPAGDATAARDLPASDPASTLLADMQPQSGPSATTDVSDGSQGSNDGNASQRGHLARVGPHSVALVRAGQDGADDVPVTAKSNETATVLDSRRFLAPASPSTSSSQVLAGLTGDKEWVTAMNPASALQNIASEASSGKVVNTLKIELNPHSLGAVTANMRLAGDQLSIEIRVQSQQAYQHMKDDESRMLDVLKSHGYSIDSVNVVLQAPTAGSADSATGQNPGGGQGANGSGQTAGNNAGQQFSQGGRDSRSDSAASFLSEAKRYGSASTSDGSSSAAGSGLYL